VAVAPHRIAVALLRRWSEKRLLSDASQLVGQTGDGVALVAWRGDLVVRSVTFEGETPDQADIIWGYTDPQLFQPGRCSE
jgi:hypothetical protein